MKKEPAVKRRDELRREYDLSRLKGGVRGKYYHRASAGMNLVLIEPDLANLFPWHRIPARKPLDAARLWNGLGSVK